MKILSIDTSSNVCGVSILEDTNLICKLDTNTGRTHSENLMPMIQEAFEKTNFKLKDIDLIICNIGPGSFTGIRIGVSTAKAFSDSLDIPSIGINSLEALSYNLIEKINEKEYVFSIINCNNDNCYFSLLEKKNNILETLIEPQTDTIESALAILENYCNDTLKNPYITFVGDSSEIYKNKIQEIFPSSKFANKEDNILNSYSLGIAGFNKYNSGVELEKLLPLYLKKPQAQKQLEEKLRQEGQV